MQNDNRLKEYPEAAERFNWGAMILTPLWAVFHKKYILAVLSVIPFVGFVVSLISLIYGGRWAWDSRDWKSEFSFKESLTKWNIASLLAFLLTFVVLFIIIQ